MTAQDWLDTEFEEVGVLHEDAQLARQWLLQMGRAADKNNLAMQYCMSYTCGLVVSRSAGRDLYYDICVLSLQAPHYAVPGDSCCGMLLLLESL